MPVYRMYWVGADDHFKLVKSVECASDEEALATAETMKGDFAAMEVWETKRLVGRVGASELPRKEA